MGFLEWALRFFRSVAPETLTHLDNVEAEAARISAEKMLRDERDCYQRELMRLGYTPDRLAAKVHAYRRGLLVEVRKAS